MSTSKVKNEYPNDEGTVEDLGADRAGARARALQIARRGLDPTHLDVSERRRDLARYRAAVSLLWDRERILVETGWSLQKLMAVEDQARAEARRLADELDPRIIYMEYKTQQLQAAAELENLATTFRKSSQFNALVAAVKARAEILDRVVKMGQELGLITRAAREVEITARVDLRKLSITELRVQLAREVRDLKHLLAPMDEVEGVAGTVLRRVLSPPVETSPATVSAETPPRRVARVRTLREVSGAEVPKTTTSTVSQRTSSDPDRIAGPSPATPASAPVSPRSDAGDSLAAPESTHFARDVRR